ncbi:MAG TPA: hypothetical protein VGD10_00095 [Allosphingosinicella sp.]|uniref:hypothetical protein n=1 Tax=Allosphingosinicella sp. TaxID=2823234 RepID=UPI002EDB082B
MRSTIFTMAAVSALAIGVPAAAQTANANIVNRIGNLQTQIQAGVQAGTITRAEAQPLRQQYRQLRDLERQYSANGLTQTERRDLQTRIQNLREQIRFAARNDATRYGNSGFIDANRDGWDDRDANRDGRIDATYGQGGPYEEACETRGGIGGVLDSVLGRDNDCGLRVGMRAGANLYAVPYQYRNQFRDGNGVVYRSDGQNIYQIDARTQVVTRVWDIP